VHNRSSSKGVPAEVFSTRTHAMAVTKRAAAVMEKLNYHPSRTIKVIEYLQVSASSWTGFLHRSVSEARCQVARWPEQRQSREPPTALRWLSWLLIITSLALGADYGLGDL
jgi:hypothetical protein